MLRHNASTSSLSEEVEAVAWIDCSYTMLTEPVHEVESFLSNQMFKSATLQLELPQIDTSRVQDGLSVGFV
jgi:hypothetical protein